MSERRSYQDEKEEEKEGEKQHEKEEKEEKSWDEKYRRDPLSAIVWAVILIWAGIVFLGDNLGMLRGIRLLEAWDFVFIGAGVIVLLEALIRVLMPEYRRPITGTVIFGVVLLAIGLGDAVSWGVVGAIALVVVGVSLLVRGFRSNR